MYNTTLFSKGVLKTFSLDINEYIDTTIGFSMLYDYAWLNFYSLNQLSYEYLFSKSVGIGLQYDFYINYSYYHSLPNYLSYYNEIELFVKWHLK